MTETGPRLRLFRPLAAMREAPAGPGYEIRAQADNDDNTATILLYDEIGGWWGIEASAFVRDLMALDAKKINVHINSPGGSVYDGIAIYQALRNHKAHITTYIDGLAASAASLIALAGDRRVVAPYGTAMIHNPWGFCLGDAADMSKAATDLNRVADNMAALYAKRAGGEVAEWREVMAAETWYSADEALAAGLVHEVQEDADKADPDNDKATQARWDLSVFAYAGRDKAPPPRIPGAPRAATPPKQDSPPPKDPPAAEPDPSNKIEEDRVSELNATVRQWLGLADDTDDAAVEAAVKARQTEHEQMAAKLAEVQAKAVEAEKALTAKEQAAANLEEKVSQLVDQMTEQGEALARINAEKDAATKASVLNAAQDAGKFAPADRDKWSARYDKSPEVTTEVLASIPAQSKVPTQPVGHTGSAEPETDVDAEWATVAHLWPAQTAGKDN